MEPEQPEQNPYEALLTPLNDQAASPGDPLFDLLRDLVIEREKARKAASEAYQESTVGQNQQMF